MSAFHSEGSRRAPSRRITSRLSYQVLEKLIFDARFMLLAAYLGIIAMLATFVAFSLWHSAQFCLDVFHGDEAAATVGMLSGLDGIMIANVVYLITAGSYVVYVKDRLSDLTFESKEDRPPALRHLSPGTLKEKMAASLIGVSAINLLQILINVGSGVGQEHISWNVLAVKVSIHVTLLIGLIIFAYVNRGEGEVSVAHQA